MRSFLSMLTLCNSIKQTNRTKCFPMLFSVASSLPDVNAQKLRRKSLQRKMLHDFPGCPGVTKDICFCFFSGLHPCGGIVRKKIHLLVKCCFVADAETSAVRYKPISLTEFGVVGTEDDRNAIERPLAAKLWIPRPKPPPM